MNPGPKARLTQVLGDPYRVERESGAGFRSDVYEASGAQDLKGFSPVAVPVAVKVQRTDCVEDTLVRASLEREILVQAAVSSAFVGRAIDRGQTSAVANTSSSPDARPRAASPSRASHIATSLRYSAVDEDENHLVKVVVMGVAGPREEDFELASGQHLT